MVLCLIIFHCFLNGVCRHEHLNENQAPPSLISKWRMPP
ncbi:hypothetical protein URS_2208 [Acinetobacter ursingii]|nr:hypothetical protein URS_2208 [Acinetobacter ursingii]